MRGFRCARTIQRVQLPPRQSLRCHRTSRRCYSSSKPKQSTTGSQRRDVATSWSTPGQMARERRSTCQLCGAIINNNAEISGTSTSIQRKLVNAERKRHSNRTVEGRTELDLVQDEVVEAKRLLEEAHVEIQTAQNKVTEAAFRVGQAMEEMSQIKKPLDANLEPADQ